MRAEPSSEPAATAEGRLPDFLIIGAMKSGTSSLRAYLDAHPDVFCAREQHYFNLHYERGINWYRGRFAGAAGSRIVGEKCPEYLHNASAAERMAATLPDARLIAILRDPVERAYSHYWHERRTGRETLSFADAIAAEPERAADGNQRFAYVERGRYLARLRHIASLYPRQALLVQLFEDLTADPAAAFAEACRFIGVDDRFVPPSLGEVRNPYRVYRPRWLFRLLTTNQRWRKLPPRLAHRVGALMTRKASYPPMEASVRSALIERYRDDNRALAEWLGRDIEAWAS